MLTLKTLLASIALCSLTACAGGGSAPDTVPAPVPITRSDLQFGYYADCGTTTNPDCYNIIGPHTTLMWVPAFGDRLTPEGRQAVSLSQVSTIRLGIASGIPQAMLFLDHMMLGTNSSKSFYVGTETYKPRLREYLSMLIASGVSPYVRGFYPMDEPSVSLANPDEAIQAFRDTREVLQEFPQFTQAKLAVIYFAGAALTGSDLLDEIGLDDYDLKSGILESRFTPLLSKLKPTQRVWLVPGGNAPWLQDPQAFLNYAQGHPQVAGIIAFAYFKAFDTGPGIGTNGLLPAYCKAGMQIKKPGVTPSC